MMPYRYRIEELTFSDNTTVKLPAMTLIVGANNSGKSRALKDITKLTASSTPQGGPVVKGAKVQLPPKADVLRTVYGISPTSVHGTTVFSWLQPDLEGRGQMSATAFWPDGFHSVINNPTTFAQYFGGQLTAFLTTANRLRLVMAAAARDLNNGPNRLLPLLYDCADSRKIEMQIRKIIADAFPKTELALDYTKLTQIEFRVGQDFSSLPLDPREARHVLRKCESLDEQGDGLRSYAGMVTALTALNRAVFLIDEPEAFLHPPQAFRMGKFLAAQASADKQLIIATHSADILRGIIFHSSDVQVVRLDRIDATNHVHVLDHHELKKLVTDPLLSTSNVLDGLFYSSVVVTEADADSRFFHSVSTRFDPSADIHFVNADNKQTVPKVLASYKKLGVRCAGIVDIDVLNRTDEFRTQMEAAGFTGEALEEAVQAQKTIDAEVKNGLVDDRIKATVNHIDLIQTLIQKASSSDPHEAEKALTQIKREAERLIAETSAWQKIKKEGAGGLLRTREQFNMLYERCASVGLFINPCGELEASLNELGMPWSPHKREWIQKALQLLQNFNPDRAKQPWKFIEDIHKYLRGAEADTKLESRANSAV